MCSKCWQRSICMAVEIRWARFSQLVHSFLKHRFRKRKGTGTPRTAFACREMRPALNWQKIPWWPSYDADVEYKPKYTIKQIISIQNIFAKPLYDYRYRFHTHPTSSIDVTHPDSEFNQNRTKGTVAHFGVQYL